MGNEIVTRGETDHYAIAVDAIYETAITPERWPDALQAVANVLGDVGATLNYERSDGRFGAIVSPSLLVGIDDYNSKWYRHDIRIERYLQRRYLAADTVTDLELGLVEEHHSHPFFTEFLRKFGLRWFLSVSIAPDRDVFAQMCVHRAIDKQDFTAEERAILLRLGQHAEKSLRLGLRLMESEARSEGLSGLLSRLNMGVFLLDGLGRVVFANETAQGFIGDALLLDAERLTAREPLDRSAFQSALSAAAHPQAEDARDLRPIMLQRGSRQDAPLAIYILPLRSSLSPALEHFLVRSQFIVLAVEVKSGAPADPALVRDLLGLTLGEARVAALIGAGLTPREASQRLDISEATARTVLKRVFQKAGVSRQSELAALLARAVVGPR